MKPTRSILTEKEWTFDRYRYGRLMAEGAKVHADTAEDALHKAKTLFSDERDDSIFKHRQC